MSHLTVNYEFTGEGKVQRHGNEFPKTDTGDGSFIVGGEPDAHKAADGP